MRRSVSCNFVCTKVTHFLFRETILPVHVSCIIQVKSKCRNVYVQQVLSLPPAGCLQALTQVVQGQRSERQVNTTLENIPQSIPTVIFLVSCGCPQTYRYNTTRHDAQKNLEPSKLTKNAQEEREQACSQGGHVEQRPCPDAPCCVARSNDAGYRQPHAQGRNLEQCLELGSRHGDPDGGI